MEQYISKSAVKAEIRKYIKNSEAFLKYHHNRNDKSVYAFEQEKLVMCDLLYFLDTLEVKEVDLDGEVEKCLKQHHMLAVGKKDFTEIAKHFFELGRQVSNKSQKGENI